MTGEQKGVLFPRMRHGKGREDDACLDFRKATFTDLENANRLPGEGTVMRASGVLENASNVLGR